MMLSPSIAWLALVVVLAQVPQGAPPPSPSTEDAAGASHSAAGIVASFDRKTKTLRVRRQGKIDAFDVSHASFWVGSRSVDSDEVQQEARVIVRFLEKDGLKVADTVRISPVSTRPKGN
jgi:hypothetical protein